MGGSGAGERLGRAAAAELGCRGMRGSSFAPGPTEGTPMAAGVLADPPTRTRIAARIPLSRLGTAKDVAEAALWLASDDCFVTGEVLQVNGGRAIPTLT